MPRMQRSHLLDSHQSLFDCSAATAPPGEASATSEEQVPDAARGKDHAAGDKNSKKPVSVRAKGYPSFCLSHRRQDDSSYQGILFSLHTGHCSNHLSLSLCLRGSACKLQGRHLYRKMLPGPSFSLSHSPPFLSLSFILLIFLKIGLSLRLFNNSCFHDRVKYKNVIFSSLSNPIMVFSLPFILLSFLLFKNISIFMLRVNNENLIY